VPSEVELHILTFTELPKQNRAELDGTSVTGHAEPSVAEVAGSSLSFVADMPEPGLTEPSVTYFAAPSVTEMA
jgi:hypothetical protein